MLQNVNNKSEIMEKLEAKKYHLFMYEINGVDTYYIAGINKHREYISFKTIGIGLDATSVCATLYTLYGDACEMYVSYNDIYMAIKAFLNTAKNISRLGHYVDTVDATMALWCIKSPEEKSHECEKNEDIQHSHKIKIYSNGIHCATKDQINRAYLDHVLSNLF